MTYVPEYNRRPGQMDKNRARKNAYLKANPLRRKEHKLRARYGMSLEDFNQRSREQMGRCAISFDEMPLLVDHHHEKNVVRGLLCESCNRAVGLFHDDPMRMLRAAMYLRQDVRVRTPPIANPEGIQNSNRARHLWDRYRLTEDDFWSLVAEQDSRCPICQKAATLTVDHDHINGHVRGLLCGSCNRGLGFLRDNPVLAIAGWAYLGSA